MKEFLDVTLSIDNVVLPVDFTRESTAQILLPLLSHLTALQREADRRILVFLGAAPGAGKSVLVSYLEHLSREVPGLTPMQALGQDGFHFPNAYLLSHHLTYEGETMTLRSVKGWPETIDHEKLYRKLRELKEQDEVLCPVYDRNLHEPVDDQLRITEKIVIVEGMWMNYDTGDWAKIAHLADYQIMLLARIDVLEARAVARKVRGGMTEEAARTFFRTTDVRAIRRIIEGMGIADLYLESLEDHDLKSYGENCPPLASFLP
ncbi:MAG: nucleoside/nucleotide kinase family protein [Lachnospiraceae bacterium]|nr:nucleoside/nucleotide kinase family protein [Lachnospiraceae bacterium]